MAFRKSRISHPITGAGEPYSAAGLDQSSQCANDTHEFGSAYPAYNKAGFGSKSHLWNAVFLPPETQFVKADTPLNAGAAASKAGRIRVLFVVKRLIGGGAERVISTLVRHVSRLRFEPSLATLSLDGPYRQDIPQDVIVHEFSGSEMKWAIPQLISLVRRTRPDVVLSTLIETNMAVLLAQPFFPAGTKVVIRDSSNPAAILKHRVPLPVVSRRLYRWLYPRAHAIVCQSEAMRADFLRHLPAEAPKVRRIYNGVDLAMIEQRAAGPSPYRGPGPNLLAVGRLDSGKNFPLLLDAFAVVRELLPDARLTILGSGPDEALLKQRARELRIDDAVNLAGFQNNPFPYYRHADLYLQTSTYEGLPNALLEALALGTPAVATAETGATEEIAKVAGSVRLVREPGAGAFANAVLEVLRGPRPALRRDAFLQVFGLESMMTQYEELLAGLVGKHLQGASHAGAIDGA
jgi:glycosyltransferase involved in cell wall biosynthesis